MLQFVGKKIMVWHKNCQMIGNEMLKNIYGDLSLQGYLALKYNFKKLSSVFLMTE